MAGGFISNIVSGIGKPLASIPGQVGSLFQVPGAQTSAESAAIQSQNAANAAAGRPYAPFTAGTTAPKTGQAINTSVSPQKKGVINPVVPPKTSANTSPYSFENYYAAHPNAKPGYVEPNAPPTNTVGRKAPPGMEYNLQGQLIPLPGQTTNAQGTTVPIPQNVNAGGGTQTNFPSIVGGLASTASQPSELFVNAGNQALDYQRQLNKLQQEQAQGIANIQNSGTPLSQAQGEAGAINTLYAQRENALANAFQGAASLLPSATGQQGVQQSGLSAAGGLAAPQGANIFGTYNPLNPSQYTGYGGGQGGGIGTAGETSGLFGIAQNFPQQQLAFNQATSVKTGFENWLKNPANKSVMSSDANLVNELKSWAQGGQFSDPRYPELNQFLNEYLNTVTPLIGASGNVTNFKQGIVQSMINPTSQIDSIVSQIDNLHNIASGKLDEIRKMISGGQTKSQQSGGQSGGSNFYSSDWFSS